MHIEAFASYFARLAHIHSCSLVQLARFLSSTHSAQVGRAFKLCESTLYSDRGAGLFGYRERVEAYVSIVEKATGCLVLRRCTLIPLQAALGRQCLDSVRPHRAWCEQCFREDQRSDTGPYDRMLWTLQAIDRCPDHRIVLRWLCPTCSEIQQFYHRAGDPGICWKCGQSLVGPPQALQAQLNACFGERDLCELVHAIAVGQVSNVDPGAIGKFQDSLREIVSPLAKVIDGIAAISGSARMKGNIVKPGLRTLLRKAHAAGVSLLHILEDPEGAALVAGQFLFDRNMIAATARIRHPKQIVQEVENALAKQLKLSRTLQIPPLSELAHTCGVSEGYIRHHCPSLVKRYQSHRRAASVYRTNAMRRRCVQMLSSIEYQERTRHLRENVKKLAIQLSVDAQCGVRTARWAVRKVLKS